MRSLRMEEHWSIVWWQISRLRSEIRAPCDQLSCNEQKHRKEWKCYHKNPRARLGDPTSDLERHHQYCWRLHRQDCRRSWRAARREKSKWFWRFRLCRKLILRLQIRSRNSSRNFANIKKVVIHPLLWSWKILQATVLFKILVHLPRILTAQLNTTQDQLKTTLTWAIMQNLLNLKQILMQRSTRNLWLLKKLQLKRRSRPRKAWPKKSRRLYWKKWELIKSELAPKSLLITLTSPNHSMSKFTIKMKMRTKKFYNSQLSAMLAAEKAKPKCVSQTSLSSRKSLLWLFVVTTAATETLISSMEEVFQKKLLESFSMSTSKKTWTEMFSRAILASWPFLKLILRWLLAH